MSIQIDHISKDFGRTSVLKDISLDIATGELVALLGPSGSGKTTLLRIIAGLEFPNEGEGRIAFHGADVTFQSAHARKAPRNRISRPMAMTLADSTMSSMPTHSSGRWARSRMPGP